MTNKQKLAAKKILENPSLPISKVMRDVGYSSNTAVDPGNLTKSKGWQELMDEKLPDDKLLDVHLAALDATKIVTSHTEPDYSIPDHPTRLKAVELGYKIKHKSDTGNIAVQVNTFVAGKKSEYGI